MTRFRYVVFDLDGTLIDSYQALTIALNRAGAQYLPKPLEVVEVRALVGEGVERLLQKTFSIHDVPDALISSFEEEYERVCCQESHLLDDVQQTLDDLATLDVVMGVCTNKPTSFSRQIIDHLGLALHLPVVVGPDRAGARKPDPTHVWRTIEEMGGTSAQSLFVGDMPIDIEAARNAGIPVATIATGSASLDELRAREPDFMLERLHDLVAVVSGMSLTSTVAHSVVQ
jgi:phosphoglycolate phosphatase